MKDEDQEYLYRLYTKTTKSKDVYQSAAIECLLEYETLPDDKTLLKILNKHKSKEYAKRKKNNGFVRGKENGKNKWKKKYDIIYKNDIMMSKLSDEDIYSDYTEEEGDDDI